MINCFMKMIKWLLEADESAFESVGSLFIIKENEVAFWGREYIKYVCE